MASTRAARASRAVAAWVWYSTAWAAARRESGAMGKGLRWYVRLLPRPLMLRQEPPQTDPPPTPARKHGHW
eukprot:2325160-Pleurochrysis_carterae.AAC.1